MQSEIQPAAGAPRHYDLVHREGERAVVLFYRDVGITLDGEGLAWTSDGQARRCGWQDVTSVRLWVIPAEDPICACRIGFRRGPGLTIIAGNRAGVADSEREEIYRAFLQDLHARLQASGAPGIRYETGAGGGARRTAGVTAATLLVLLCVALPLVLLVVTGEARVLFILLGGAVLAIPMAEAVRNNAPGSYEPGRIPKALLP